MKARIVTELLHIRSILLLYSVVDRLQEVFPHAMPDSSDSTRPPHPCAGALRASFFMSRVSLQPQIDGCTLLTTAVSFPVI